MTPAARVQAAIEVLDDIIAASKGQGAAADTLIARWFAAHRYAGSGDRRAVRELVYRAVRAFGDAPASGRAAFAGLARDDGDLARLFDGSRYGPPPLLPGEGAAVPSLLPAWLEDRMPDWASAEERLALLDRAPLDVRVNTHKMSRETALTELPAEAAPILSSGLRYEQPVDLSRHPLMLGGGIEVQDLGSQYVASVCAARPGEYVIDLCAGAGGKALALAAEMQGTGSILACDIDRGRLRRLDARAARAGAATIETLLLDPGREEGGLAPFSGRADLVLVDAPCTGSGTWRRNPEARWRLTPGWLERQAVAQSRLLDLGWMLVRPGGRLVYAVCSVLDAEGRDRIEQFLIAHGDATAMPPEIGLGRARGAGRLLTPLHDGSDGFFVAAMAKAC